LIVDVRALFLFYHINQSSFFLTTNLRSLRSASWRRSNP